MKTAVIFFITFCLLLSGCISPAEFTVDPSSQSQSSSEAEVRLPDYIYDPKGAMYYTGSFAAVCEDGYYLVINRILHFYEVQSDTLFPLCTKEFCLHRDKTCDAYCYHEKNNTELYKNGWAANAYNYWIVYHRDHLYTIGYHPDKGRVLFQYSRDYAEQREVVWLEDFKKAPDIRFIDQSLFLHGRYAYYATYLYDIDKVQKMDYETVCTVHRVNLEGKGEAEKLFTFDCIGEFRGFRTWEFDNEIYFIVEQEFYRILSDEDSKDPYQVTSGVGKAFRYDEEKNQVELIWSYDGDKLASLFEAEGAIPRNMYSEQYLKGGGDYLITADGDYVYLAGYPENNDEHGLMPTSIAAVNLNTGQGRVLYETSYRYIEQLESDGKYYYFIEIAKGYTYLTTIDKEGNLIRRYEVPLDEAFIEKEETRLRSLKESGHGYYSREDYGLGPLRLLITDGRYITLGGYSLSTYKNLSSRAENNSFYYVTDEGLGVIDAAEFINGKDVEIRQIYERTDPFN